MSLLTVVASTATVQFKLIDNSSVENYKDKDVEHKIKSV